MVRRWGFFALASVREREGKKVNKKKKKKEVEWSRTESEIRDFMAAHRVGRRGVLKGKKGGAWRKKEKKMAGRKRKGGNGAIEVRRLRQKVDGSLERAGSVGWVKTYATGSPRRLGESQRKKGREGGGEGRQVLPHTGGYIGGKSSATL